MVRVLVFGASVTWGAYDEMGGWVDRLKRNYIQNYLESHGKDDVGKKVHDLNMGVPGNTTSRLLVRFKHEIGVRLKKASETIAVICLGIIDSEYDNENRNHHVDPGTFRSNILELIHQAESMGVRVLFVGLNPVDESVLDPLPWKKSVSLRNDYIQKYEQIISEVCTENGVGFAPIFERMYKQDYLGFLVDGVHLNSKGHETVFDLVKPRIEELVLVDSKIESE